MEVQFVKKWVCICTIVAVHWVYNSTALSCHCFWAHQRGQVGIGGGVARGWQLLQPRQQCSLSLTNLFSVSYNPIALPLLQPNLWIRPNAMQILPLQSSPFPIKWAQGLSWLDFNDGHFFETMGWSFFFSKAPLPSMVFQWFYQPWTITIECFFTDQPLISMVFRWFSQIQVRWSAMVSTLKET